MGKMKLEVKDQEVALLQFMVKNDPRPFERYIVVDDKEVEREFERLLVHNNGNVSKMEPLNLDEDNDKFWVAYSADCAFPPMYLVRAMDMIEAVEVFLDKTDICTISEEDLKDYFHSDGEEVSGLFYADCGKKCDISQLQVHELELTVVITKEGIKAISGSLGSNRLPKIVPSSAKAPMHGHRTLDIT